MNINKEENNKINLNGKVFNSVDFVKKIEVIREEMLKNDPNRFKFNESAISQQAHIS